MKSDCIANSYILRRIHHWFEIFIHAKFNILFCFRLEFVVIFWKLTFNGNPLISKLAILILIQLGLSEYICYLILNLKCVSKMFHLHSVFIRAFNFCENLVELLFLHLHLWLIKLLLNSDIFVKRIKCSWKVLEFEFSNQ